MSSVRLAAIDVGSNSVHMVIADVSPEGHLEVVDRVKEMVRLGRKSFTTGKLTAESMDLTIGALRNFVRLARAQQVDQVRAVATSAVREARNREGFIRRLRRETGLQVQVISGPEEARLIFRAARHALGLDGGPHLVVDMGGGSVELVLVQDGAPLLMRSFPLGAVRLSERFLTADPPSADQVAHLQRHLAREMGDLLMRLRHARPVRAIGTSGTAHTLVAMARAGRGEELGRLHGAAASADEIAGLRERLLTLGAAQRADLPGIDSKRADLMPAAAVLIDYILRETRTPELVACTWALREGLLLDLAKVPSDAATTVQVRKRSVRALAARFAGANAHGRQVARIALKLYDGLASDLRLPARSREMLEYAALLHDIGHAIEHDRHHRHTHYLIQNAELLGFDPAEIEVIALIARGHRKQAPKLTSPELQSLPAPLRRQVRALAAILRVADAIDRSHFSVVRDIRVSRAPGRVTITVDAGDENPELELWATERRTDLLARLLDSKVVLRTSHQAHMARAMGEA